MPFKYNIIEYRVSLCLITLDLVAFFIDSHWQLIPGFNSSHCKICLTKKCPALWNFMVATRRRPVASNVLFNAPFNTRFTI